MKICLLSSMHPPNDKRVHDKEARSLAKAGFEVVHICPSANAETDGQLRMVDGVGIRQYASRKGLCARIRQLGRLYRMAKAENADAYHCNEVDSWFVGVLLKIRRGKICVFDVHEHYPSTFAESRFPKFLQPAVAGSVRLVFKILLPFTDRIVLAKRTVSDDFRCRDDKKVLVQNFTPRESLAIAGERAVREPGASLTVVHLGLFSKVRGWPEVLEALAQTNHQVRLQVIGTINDGTYDEFQARVGALDLQDRVQVFDWMPFDEAFGYLLRADIGLIAFQPHIQNHIFAMPHKLFDYMAAGMSVLMPKQAVEVAPIVYEAQCGILIDPSDPNDIAVGIDTLFHDAQAAHAMGQRGQDAVMHIYNWETEAQKLIEMYQSLG